VLSAVLPFADSLPTSPAVLRVHAPLLTCSDFVFNKTTVYKVVAAVPIGTSPPPPPPSAFVNLSSFVKY
jgi:hypothetical protein